MIFLGGLVVDLDRGSRNPHVKYLAKSYPSGQFLPLNNDSPAAAKFSPPTSQPEPHHGTQVMILKGDAASIQRGAGFA